MAESIAENAVKLGEILGGEETSEAAFEIVKLVNDIMETVVEETQAGNEEEGDEKMIGKSKKAKKSKRGRRYARGRKAGKDKISDDALSSGLSKLEVKNEDDDMGMAGPSSKNVSGKSKCPILNKKIAEPSEFGPSTSNAEDDLASCAMGNAAVPVEPTKKPTQPKIKMVQLKGKDIYENIQNLVEFTIRTGDTYPYNLEAALQGIPHAIVEVDPSDTIYL